jgi:hypothetical protein
MHSALETALRGLPWNKDLNAYECGIVQKALDILASVEDDGELHLETRMPTGQYLGLEDPNLCWGTADIVQETPLSLRIIDFKTGRIPVDPVESEQLIAYLLGAIELYGSRPSYELGILQPTVSDSISWWRVDDPIPYATRIDDAIAEALSPIPRFNPGVKQCQWCPVGGECSYRQRWIVETDFGQDPARMSVDDMSDVLLQEKAILAFLEAVRARALEIALSGEEIPGFRVARKATRERWIDPYSLSEAFEERELPGHLLMPATPLTPTQAAQIVGKEALEGLTVRPEGDLTLVKQKD